MPHFNLFLALLLAGSVTACQLGSFTTNPDSAAAPAQPTASASTTPQPVYAGTYTVRDSTDCSLSITITRQGPGYAFSCSNGRTVQGTVEISEEADGTYFTFVGLKGDDPEEDIPALWQDSVLLIQNYGNSMNEYTRFSNCEAKYLELYRR
ncbi:hypothetical protein [Hymenobacter pini]|uniref:hypothetical protein n=1 Tax=Hymenobacter pini TaxID=2880879 RepID=UPI001CF24BAF|nr:hypothetical protein [Hymenobacter pini]MCA8832690.1 hypothetical protein [Hymenobacter pini]